MCVSIYMALIVHVEILHACARARKTTKQQTKLAFVQHKKQKTRDLEREREAKQGALKAPNKAKKLDEDRHTQRQTSVRQSITCG